MSSLIDLFFFSCYSMEMAKSDMLVGYTYRQTIICMVALAELLEG
jgi:hypothetical protein